MTPPADPHRWVSAALFFAVMAAVIVGVDVAFLKNRLWLRLVVNVAIVALFAAIYITRFRS